MARGEFFPRSRVEPKPPPANDLRPWVNWWPRFACAPVTAREVAAARRLFDAAVPSMSRKRHSQEA